MSGFLAKNIRCPRCGKGLVDVAPDCVVGGNDDGGGYRGAITHAHCEGGHALFIEWSNARPTTLLIDASKERVI